MIFKLGTDLITKNEVIKLLMPGFLGKFFFNHYNFLMIQVLASEVI